MLLHKIECQNTTSLMGNTLASHQYMDRHCMNIINVHRTECADLGQVYAAPLPGVVHPAGDVDRVAPDVVQRLLRAHHARDHLARGHAHAQLEVRGARQLELRVVHVAHTLHHLGREPHQRPRVVPLEPG